MLVALKRFIFSSLRIELLLLVLVGIIPFCTLLIYWGWERGGLSTRLLLELGTITAFAFAATYVFARVFILNRIEALVEATKKITTGDLSARIGLEDEIGQLGHLIRSFDGMAESLEKRQQQLRESEELYRTLVDISPDAIVMATLEGGVQLGNRQALSMLGYKTLDECVRGRNIAEIVAAEDRPAIQAGLRSVLQGERLSNREYTLLRRDGTRIPGELNISPVLDGRGEPKGFICVVRDISERKRLEAQFFQAQKMEAVGRLAGGVAHDFNNLLAAIIGFSELLLEDPALCGPIRRDLEAIKNAGDRGATLTRQLLAFSRKQVLQTKVVDLNTVVRDTDRILRRLIGEDIDLKMALAPELGRVSADPGQIEQILMNLAVNSRDAMPRGGKLTIETSNRILGESYARTHVPIMPGCYVMLALSDTGHGMDAETQSHIFEPFFTTKEQGKGTGLGLSTVYGIVKQSGGYLWVYSEPGHGTTFKIYLPRIDMVSETLAPRAPQKVAKRRGSETILVAEDDKEVRRMMSEWFHANGYTVLEAADGQEAFKVFENYPGPIHLVVTDLVMPHMGGLELSKNLGRLGKKTKILFLSGYSDQAVIQHGILDKGAPFLQKPFGMDALAAKVAELLDSP